MSDMDGLEATHIIKNECPEADVLIVAMHENQTVC